MCLYLLNPFVIESPIKTRLALDVDTNSTYLLCKSIQSCLLCRGKLCIEAMFKMMGVVAGTEGPSSSFTCEKMASKISGPVNELFSLVVINLKLALKKVLVSHKYKSSQEISTILCELVCLPSLNKLYYFHPRIIDGF